jgi:hypothetical protein
MCIARMLFGRCAKIAIYMRITKIISTAVAKGKLIIKVLGLGANDVQTVYNVLPFGIDSNPNKNIRGIWAKTDNLEDRILLGVLFERPTANTGETRLYSENTNGVEVFSLYLKNDGIAEIGGNADNLVRYKKLDDGLQSLKTKINTELEKIRVGLTGVGGTYTKQDVSVDISEAKIDNLKSS